MTDGATNGTTQGEGRSTRRGLLAGAAAGVAAWAASSLPHPGPAEAATAGQLDYQSTASPVIQGAFTGAGGGVGVKGASGEINNVPAYGVEGVVSGSGAGVYGHSELSTGVLASGVIGVDATGAPAVRATAASTSGAGVEAINTATGGSLGLYAHVQDAAGISALGENYATTGAAVGVKGISHGSAGIAIAGVASSSTGGTTGVFGQVVSPTGIGVYGQTAAGSSETYGVYGQTDSSAGRGVFGRAVSSGGGQGVVGQGDAPTAIGVRGIGWDGSSAGSYGTGVQGIAGVHDKASWPAARSNTGVMGHSPAGTGVYASSSTGTALDVAGKARYSRSGAASVLAGKTYVDVTVPGGIGSRTLIHATMQTYRSGVAIAAVRPNYPSTGKARIYLTKVGSTTSSTKVAWIATEY